METRTEREIYQATERDHTKSWTAEAIERAYQQFVEAQRAAKVSKSKIGLHCKAERARLLKLSIDYRIGLGQARLDRAAGLPYSEERMSEAYNLGYYNGWHAN